MIGLLQFTAVCIVRHIDDTMPATAIRENLLGAGAQHGGVCERTEQAEKEDCPQEPVLER